MFERFIEDQLNKSVELYAVTILLGSRQSGKSTEVNNYLNKQSLSYKTYSLDNNLDLQVTLGNPESIFNVPEEIIFIDELQENPGLIKNIRSFVDKQKLEKNQGKISNIKKFILTGSNAQFLEIESMIGRANILHLDTLTQSEIINNQYSFIEDVFSDKTNFNKYLNKYSLDDIIELISKGGYPEPLLFTHQKDRTNWFNNYVNLTIKNDIKKITNIHNSKKLEQLFRILCSMPASELNASKLASQIGKLSDANNSKIKSPTSVTIEEYCSLLEQTYLIKRIPGWGKHRLTTAKSKEKYFSLDTGLAIGYSHFTPYNLKQNKDDAGHFFENFIITEIYKQRNWFQEEINFYHFQTVHKGDKEPSKEIDLLLEFNGKIVAIEIKLKDNLSSNQDEFKHIKYFQKKFPEEFHRGIVIYTGNKFYNFEKDLHAIPFNYIWEGENEKS